MTSQEVPETVATYLRLRGLEPRRGAWRRKRRRGQDDENVPFAPGRDPKPLGDALETVARTHGWSSILQQHDLVRLWPEVVGEQNARHSRAVSLVGGMLTIRCESTAWMRVLSYMRAQILTTLLQRFPDAGIDEIRFVGPDIPTWKHGLRTVQGRGPRDTYG